MLMLISTLMLTHMFNHWRRCLLGLAETVAGCAVWHSASFKAVVISRVSRRPLECNQLVCVWAIIHKEVVASVIGAKMSVAIQSYVDKPKSNACATVRPVWPESEICQNYCAFARVFVLPVEVVTSHNQAHKYLFNSVIRKNKGSMKTDNGIIFVSYKPHSLWPRCASRYRYQR